MDKDTKSVILALTIVTIAMVLSMLFAIGAHYIPHRLSDSIMNPTGVDVLDTYHHRQ